MPKIDNIAGMIATRITPVFFLIEKTDKTGSLIKIYELLKAFKSTLDLIQKQNLYDVRIKAGFYVFSTADTYLHSLELSSLEHIDIHDISNSEKVDVTHVLTQLATDLSRKTLLNETCGYNTPNIILILDGSKEYCGTTNESLNSNRWFKRAMKFAFVVNDINESNYHNVKNIVSHDEAIVRVKNIENAVEIFKLLFRPNNEVISGSICVNDRDESDEIVFTDPISDAEDNSGWLWDDGDDWN